ncbi:hypothetical protein DPMN_070601 [Dreissena polymorpha]|uniref:Uncharacterized protein n=1 Tax=Dreissena polymorpha TaxID=45954 RepID=A0A9D3Z5F0_DREPO|nr:hypothetical protein DPMN_070601 [Dreissena polymorpha]
MKRITLDRSLWRHGYGVHLATVGITGLIPTVGSLNLHQTQSTGSSQETNSIA